jgi:Fe-S cluster assembly protein SufD
MSAALRSFETQWRERVPDALQPVREQAMQRFLKLGMPSLRDETWRYTDLRSVAAQSFASALCADGGAAQTSPAVSLVDAGQNAITLTMVNGCPLQDANIQGTNDIEINSIQALLKSNPQSLRRFFESGSDADQRRWALLNTALFVDGLYLKISNAVSMPIVILHLSTGESTQAVHPRVIIEAEAGASAVIIEHHVSQGEAAPLSNSNTHLALARDARLEHYRVYSTGAGATHMDSLDIQQAQGSRCKQFTV